MNKKADVWISAVIYVGLAITIITIVLAASLPVINKIRDKNVAIQTKEIMHNLDTTIRDTVREGPGARRTSTIKISRGEFNIEDDAVTWTMKDSKFMFSQPGVEKKEGNLIILTTNSNIKDEYIVEITLKYDNIQLTSNLKTLMGQYNLGITNEGPITIGTTNKIKVTINELTL
ncbi:MAG: hypothetical protein PHF86_11335 [Candidatus Nanoarchaeia archaeon]|nr:hypothetical protein [Candidatus Nanoarchaeia archaeon]